MTDKKPENETGPGNAVPHPHRRVSAFRRGLAGLIFVALAGLVFLVSEHQARKTSVGFPDFSQSAFSLTDQNGIMRSNADFAGKPVAVFFGFTYCPDVCPTTLLTLAGVTDDLANSGIDSTDLQILFITVDHERDTPAQLKSYLSLFDVPVVGLTGGAAAVAAAVGAFGAYAKRVVTETGDVTYDHSAAVYLYRSDGTFQGTISFNEPDEYVIEKVRSILR